jgi:hypothetical protein
VRYPLQGTQPPVTRLLAGIIYLSDLLSRFYVTTTIKR